jgi:ketosteroid isomerase-like protein
MRLAHVGFTTHLREEIMRKKLSVLALALAVVTPALADDAKTIAQRVDDQWIEAYNKKDAAALTALYTADAVLLPQGTDQPIIGENNIRKFYDEFVKQKLDNMTLPVAEANMLDQKSLYQGGTWRLMSEASTLLEPI